MLTPFRVMSKTIVLDLLPQSTITRNRNLDEFSHLDFVLGDRAKKEIYDEIIGDINKLEGKKGANY
ncbi:hypothetical protein PRIPAC_87009 [Pristionchus pacificus]|uniref:Uncharacterized protein n=1 Tax=Pristionchus pacificus TaxID=54126 RepID=A0A454XZ72_PRIPA|nr:hypothetical protein PRIPAC_87009 [Pristionchus pacificus]|eukprot:PDM68967.1 hypothetical protein PRIPAC_47269 [Pristionchus pacificus]